MIDSLEDLDLRSAILEPRQQTIGRRFESYSTVLFSPPDEFGTGQKIRLKIQEALVEGQMRRRSLIPLAGGARTRKGIVDKDCYHSLRTVLLV